MTEPGVTLAGMTDPEDAQDLQDAEDALAEIGRGAEPVPAEEVWAEILP